MNSIGPYSNSQRGSSVEERRAPNPEVAGSKPALAPKINSTKEGIGQL